MRAASAKQWREFLSAYPRIHVYTVDPGAHAIAAELVPLMRELGNFSGWFAEGWSAAHCNDCQPAAKLDSVLDATGTLLLGPQIAYQRTQLVLRKAAVAEARTVFVFDHWKNYAEHFGGMPLPNVVVVPDKIAHTAFLAATGQHAESHLRILPHPGIDAAAERVAACRCAGEPNMIAMLLDPTEVADGLGYDWRGSLAAAAAMVRARPGARLIVKPHPRQNVAAVLAEIATLNGDGKVIDLYTDNTERLLGQVSEVWGMTTSALHVALAVGKPIRSFQIGRNAEGARASNPHIEPFVIVQ